MVGTSVGVVLFDSPYSNINCVSEDCVTYYTEAVLEEGSPNSLLADFDYSDGIYSVRLLSKYPGRIEKVATIYRVNIYELINALGGGLGLFLGFSVSGTLSTLYELINCQIKK